MVLRAHYIQLKDHIPEDLREMLNSIKLVIIELVNNHVDDMIRIILLMSEKNKQMMVNLIENLDNDPPVQ